MFKLLIKLQGDNQPFVLWFNSRESAASNQELINNSPFDAILRFIDDYGHELRANRMSVTAILLIDVQRANEAQAAEALLHARQQARLQSEAAIDPMLRFHRTPPPPGSVLG